MPDKAEKLLNKLIGDGLVKANASFTNQQIFDMIVSRYVLYSEDLTVAITKLLEHRVLISDFNFEVIEHAIQMYELNPGLYEQGE